MTTSSGRLLGVRTMRHHSSPPQELAERDILVLLKGRYLLHVIVLGVLIHPVVPQPVPIRVRPPRLAVYAALIITTRAEPVVIVVVHLLQLGHEAGPLVLPPLEILGLASQEGGLLLLGGAPLPRLHLAVAAPPSPGPAAAGPPQLLRVGRWPHALPVVEADILTLPAGATAGRRRQPRPAREGKHPQQRVGGAHGLGQVGDEAEVIREMNGPHGQHGLLLQRVVVIAVTIPVAPARAAATTVPLDGGLVPLHLP